MLEPTALVFEMLTQAQADLVTPDLVADAAGERLDSWLDTNVRQPTSISIPDDPELFLDRVRYGVPRDADLPYGTIQTQSR